MDYKKLTVDELKYIINNIDNIKNEVKNIELKHNPECYIIQGVGYISAIKVNKIIHNQAQCEVIEFDTVDDELYYFEEVSYHISRLKTAVSISYEKFKQVLNTAKVALKNIEKEKKGVWIVLKSIV